MTSDSPRSPGSVDPDAVEETPDELSVVRDLVDHATQRLLGDTIEVTDEQWAEPSALPGWTRAHVATHLARNADAVARLAAWAATGERQDMYASPEARDAEIEQGAARSGMELQVDLDSSADRLTEAFAVLDAAGRWTDQVETRGGQQVPARILPLMRLAEVALHHVDLDTGYTVDQLDPAAALWLLQLVAHRMASRADCPALTLAPTGGDPVEVGPGAGDRTVVTGSATALLGWVTRRTDGSGLDGADGIDLPSYG
jgi:maleylpyruvate isomerase